MENKKLKRDLGLLTLISVGIGGIIGSGIFALPALMGAVAGPGLILSILLAGLIACILALSYAELGSAFPMVGGPYSFPKLAMGDFVGFLMGWGYFLYLFIGAAAIIDIFVVYLGFYMPGLSIGGTLTPHGISIAVATLWFLTLINIYGVKWGGIYCIVTMIGKLIPLLFIFFVGFFYLQGKNFTPFLPFGWTGVVLGIPVFFWSYTGFEAIVVPIDEIKKPSKSIPLAIIISLFVTIVIYFFIAFVFVGSMPFDSLGLKSWRDMKIFSFPLSDLMAELNLRWMVIIVGFGAILATAGSAGSRILIQARIPYAMAHDHLIWMTMAKIHPKYKTPVSSLVFSSLLTTFVLFSIPNFPSIALISSICTIIPYAAASLSVPILRQTRPLAERPFRIPFSFLFSLIGFILSTFLIYWSCWPWTLVGVLLMLAGYPAFLLFKKEKIEWSRSLWIFVYLIGIVFVSMIGDTRFQLNNFIPFQPLGLLVMPFDLLVLALFSFCIFIWAYRRNVSLHSKIKSHEKEEPLELL